MPKFISTAEFSDDRLYRYSLTRVINPGPTWPANPRPLAICGLNPSDANEIKDDPTITREIDFARRWDCDILIKVNAYAWVETKPKLMFAEKRKNSRDIVGPDNDAHIKRAIEECKAANGIFLVAWGKHIEPYRQMVLADLIGDIATCLQTNLDGTPTHPLYLPATLVPVPWKLAA